jgi:hypothetical protein
MKKLNCTDCSAWNFYNWLQEKKWSIRRAAELSDAVRMQPGFGGATVESLTDDEAGTIRGLFM